MSVRSFALGCLVALLLISPLASAQRPAKVPKIGFTGPGPVALTFGTYRAFIDEMGARGYVEGRDFAMEMRFTDGRPGRFPQISADLVQLPVEMILVGVCGAPLNAARRATQTIPIVVATCNDDMVETGVVASMNRPGGNVTGLSKLTPELAPKRLQLLKQAVPGMKRVAVLWNPGYSDFKADWRELNGAAKILGVSLHPVEVRGPSDFDAAFAAMAREQVDALITFSDVLTFVYAKRVGELVTAARLPAMIPFREVVDEGALMSYGPSLPAMWRRAADYVIRILKGANPAEMAIEQPTRFEFVINLKAAKALGLTIPAVMRLQADEVIE
jgi:putative tryptophan/tyrosine transport system substrate-binding protein